MAKLTKKEVATAINDLFVDLTPDSLVVTVTEGKGKNKKEVLDAEASFQSISQNLLYYRGLLDGADIFAKVHPEGTEEILNNRKNEFDTLYAYAEENFAEEMEEFVETMGIESFGTYDGEDGEDEEDEESNDVLSTLELDDLKAVAKALGEKVTKKDTEESLIEKIEEYEEDDINSVLEELGLLGDEEEEEEESEEDAVDYSEMSLAELRAECKERGIKYTPKMKSDELISLLEESDSEENEDASEEDETEEDAGLLDGLSVDDLKAVAKALGEKVTKKDTEESLIEKISEYEESDIEDVLSELGLLGDDEEADEEDEEAEEGSEYEGMSLSELRKECKSREIKYTPKMKEAELISLLEASDAEYEEAEDEEDEEVDEHELDEILDEEFEDEVLEKEEAEEKKTSKKAGKLPPKKRK